MRLIFLLFFILSQTVLWAQQRYEEQVPEVEQSGYYRIALSQEMIGVAVKNNFKGIRLKDQQGREVAYFIEENTILQSKHQFVDLPIVQLKTDSKNSFAIVENHQEIEALYVQIKSLEVSGKKIRIRGSHVASQWYLVKASALVLDFGQHFKENDEVFEIRFPKGNYRYYEVMITNDQEQPIEVWSVKIKKGIQAVSPEWTLLPLGNISQRDSVNKKTYLQFLGSKHQYWVRKLEFEISDSQYYQRTGKLGGNNFVLSSRNKEVVLDQGALVNRSSLLVIDNGGNIPLRVQAVKAFGIPIYLCAYISKQQQLSVVVDEDVIEVPDYDIIHFKADIPKDLSVLVAANFKQISKGAPPKVERWFESKLLMWTIIVVVGAFLLWICLKIARDLQGKG